MLGVKKTFINLKFLNLQGHTESSVAKPSSEWDLLTLDTKLHTYRHTTQWQEENSILVDPQLSMSHLSNFSSLFHQGIYTFACFTKPVSSRNKKFLLSHKRLEIEKNIYQPH